MAYPRSYTDQELEQAVVSSSSIAQTCRVLGLPIWGYARRRLVQRIATLNLSTDHFIGQRTMCGIVPKTKKLPEQRLIKSTKRERGYLLRRSLIEVGEPYQCRNCGMDPLWMGKPITLEVDHIDGDPTNSLRENLRFLCPNCHSQIPVVRKKNKCGVA